MGFSVRSVIQLGNPRFFEEKKKQKNKREKILNEG